jgi:vacuolar-type H+-ATPase subunit H
MEALIQKVLTDILLALITLGGAYAVLYINKLKAKADVEIAKIQDEKQRKLISDAFARCNDLVVKVVGFTEQTVAKELREMVKDGKINKEELMACGKNAVDEIYSQLSDETKALLELEVNDVYGYIMNAVETEVLKIKG